MPGPLTRPSAFFLRNSHYKRGLLFLSSAVPASIAEGYSFWHLYEVPKQLKYVEFRNQKIQATGLHRCQIFLKK